MTERHFIYLTPIGIIVATLFFYNTWGMATNQPWLRLNILILVVGLLAAEIVETLATILTLGIYR